MVPYQALMMHPEWLARINQANEIIRNPHKTRTPGLQTGSSIYGATMLPEQNHR